MRAAYDKTKGPVLSLGPRQDASRQDRGPSPSVWTSPVTLPIPAEDDSRNAVEAAVRNLADINTLPSSLSLESAPVVAEWVSMKRGALAAEDDTPKSHFYALSRDVQSNCTVVFVHGGAFFSNGLGSSRPTAAKLSKESGGRVIALDYRLAPQTAFPNQILDLLHLYLSLLHPPPGAFHDAVPSSSIVLAGESSGACIVLGLLQVLLQLRLQTITFHGQTFAPIPMPAGTTVLSPQADLALCLPSWNTNRDFDIWSESAPYVKADFPADAIWPSSPPREELYCGASLFAHPMVSVCTAKSWAGSPPLWFGVGQERMADSAMIVAQTAARDGVCVWWDQYEAMPHCWPFIMPKMPHSVHVFGRWGRACKDMVEQNGLRSRGSWFDVDRLKESARDVKGLTGLNSREAKTIIEAKAKTSKVYYGKKLSAQL
ncbi:Alpha/Beta hydrolase protein [Lophiotrema nucula]|uniref:Alpha/Beta hydrolase protein n=1 Tax=Lophiotrema nucula TaxID=690887 RepID=A0A6A5Z0H3_9PLEO|nr:Alpha/Beta hydrolase protein [Lophiotrema nucula]